MFFYLPTDAQLNCLKNNFKIYIKIDIKTAPTFFFNILLMVHVSIILVNDQLDAQILCFIISLLLSSTCFEHRRAHHEEVTLY
jgi:hypothetical protein